MFTNTDDWARFIPAGAGNTVEYHSSSTWRPVHPRRRGEHHIIQHNKSFGAGSSPQARGTHIDDTTRAAIYRFIPAGAGNTRRAPTGQTSRKVHPRRRGEHYNVSKARIDGLGSSPQARGTLEVSTKTDKSMRFIPAGAGNTHTFSGWDGNQTVHPRRRGEHRPIDRDGRGKSGSSPQARGTPR